MIKNVETIYCIRIMQAHIEHEVNRKRKQNPNSVITMLIFVVTKHTWPNKYKAQKGKYQQNLKCLRHDHGLSPKCTKYCKTSNYL